MKSPKKNGIGEVVTDYGRREMRIFKKGLLQRSLFDFYGDIKADSVKIKESSSVPSTPVDGDGGVVYIKSADGKLYFKSNEVSEVELSSSSTTTTNIAVTDNASTNENNAIVFVADADIDGSTNAALESDGATLTYNPSVGQVNANVFSAANNIAIGNDVNITQINASFHSLITLLEDANSDAGPIFTLKKTRGGSVAIQDNDEVGEIRFQSIDDKSPTPDSIVYGRIATSILDASDGNECGKLEIFVANDGSSQTGISINGNVSTANQIDITIGNLPTSETTINGNVTIQNTANDDVAPTLKIYNNRSNDGVDDQSAGVILFSGKDDGTPSEKTFGKIECISTDTQAGTEDSQILFHSMVNGFLVERLSLAEFGAESSLTSDFKVVGYVKSSVGPSNSPRFWLNYQDSEVVADEIIGDLTWANNDDDGHTLRIQGVATEAHASGSAGGSKLEFYTTANTTSSLALAATIGQDKSLTIEGDLTVKGNDIKDDDGTTCITFDSSGNTTIANTLNATLTGNVTGNVSGSSGSCTGNAATATLATNAQGIAGATDADVNITSDGEVIVKLDSDNDESTQKFKITNNADTEVAHIDESGNLQIDGDLTVSGSGTTSIGGTLSCADLDITGSANALTINSTTGNVAINASSTDADCILRLADNSTAGTNVIGFVATGDDSLIRNDEGNFKVKMANNATTTLDLDQNGNLDITGNILPGITEVKILPRDFIPDDAGRPAMIDDTSSDRFLESFSTAKLYANVEIPLGFKATHVHIYGSGTSAMTVYEADVNSKTVTSKGTGNIGTNLNITDVTADATNYILIELAQTSSEEVYGGIMTIAKV